MKLLQSFKILQNLAADLGPVLALFYLQVNDADNGEPFYHLIPNFVTVDRCSGSCIGSPSPGLPPLALALLLRSPFILIFTLMLTETIWSYHPFNWPLLYCLIFLLLTLYSLVFLSFLFIIAFWY